MGSANDNRRNHAKVKSNEPITFQDNTTSEREHHVIVSEFPQVYVSQAILIKGCTSGAFDSKLTPHLPDRSAAGSGNKQASKPARQEYYYTHLEDLHILSP